MEVGAAVALAEASQVSEARRLATGLARRLRLDETRSGKLSIVVTEIATNVLKHGGGGEIVLRALHADGMAGVEILGLDRGPGMPNLQEALRDGASTAGSPGIGLGAIARLSDVFDIYSVPRQGTAVLSRVWGGPLPRDPGLRIAIEGTCLPYPGEEQCGDGWAVEHFGRRSLLILVDGLGHGALAAEAAREALRIFHVNASTGPAALMEVLHAGLRSTRGAAVAVTEIDFDRMIVRFAGIGNIAAAIVSPTAKRHLVSHNGTMGHIIQRLAEFTYPWSEDAILVQHSDGLGTHWDLDRYPGLSAHSPALIAGVLYRDFRRGRDDVTVVVGRTAAA